MGNQRKAWFHAGLRGLTFSPQPVFACHGALQPAWFQVLMASGCALYLTHHSESWFPETVSAVQAGTRYARNCVWCRCWCPYAQRQRVGDITVGDYWGVQKYDPQLLVEQGGTINSKEGVSCLLINTECGQHLVEKYGAKIESYPVEFSNIAQVNTQLNRPTKHTRLRNKIFRKYKASGYAGVEAIFERDQRNQKFIWGMYDRICGMFCRKTR